MGFIMLVSGLAGADNQEIRIVCQNAEKNGTEYSVNVDHVMMPFCVRVLQERVCYHNGSFIPAVTVEDDKVTRGFTPDVIPFPFIPIFPGTSVEVGRTESCQDGNRSFDVFSDK
jgi:hypothetical protein